jgi:hypothetical protein
MPDDPWLGAAIPNGAFTAIAGMSRRHDAEIIPEDSTAEWLIEGDPVLDAGTHGVEYDAGIVGEISDEFVLVQVPAVSLVELVWKIPMEQRDEGCDAGCKKVIREFDVEVYAGLVDRVIPATFGDDAGPRDGESVCLGARLLEQLDVLCCAVI